MMSWKSGAIISLNSILSILGVVLGVAALIIVMSIMNGFETEFRTRILGVTSHITVFLWDAQPMTDPANAMTELLEIDGVVAAAPFIYYKAAIASNETGDGIAVRGIDENLENDVSGLEEKVIFGSFDFKPNPEGHGGIMIGRTLAKGLDVFIGDPLVLFSLRGEKLRAGAQPKIKKFYVSGIFETGMYQYDASMAYISLEDAANLFDITGATGIHLKTADIMISGMIADAIDNDYLDKYSAIDWREMNKNLFSWMQLEKLGMFIALSLIIAVAAFNIISTLVMIVMEKREEIGILKTMGALPGSIAGIFMRIGLVVGLFGCLSGSILGFGLCWLQKRFDLVSLPSEIYFISSLPIDVRPFDFLWVCLAAIILCFLATIYPARKAAGLSVIDVLRH